MYSYVAYYHGFMARGGSLPRICRLLTRTQTRTVIAGAGREAHQRRLGRPVRRRGAQAGGQGARAGAGMNRCPGRGAGFGRFCANFSFARIRRGRVLPCTGAASNMNRGAIRGGAAAASHEGRGLE